MFRISLLGEMAVGGDVTLGPRDLGGNKPRRVLALLSLSLGSSVPKDVLADRLWEGHPPAGRIATLESYVCLLRRSMCMTSGRNSAIRTSQGGYLLDADHVDVDLHELRRQLRGDCDAVRAAVARMRGELLPAEPYAAWAEEARAQLDDDVVLACVRGAREANGLGDHGAAAALAREALRRSPLSEPALREHMRGLVGLGDRPAALAAYETLRSRLADELGIDPEAETRAELLRVLHQDRAADSRCDRAEASAMLRILRGAIATDPDVFSDMPGAPALVAALRSLTPAV